ncbi:MAG: N-acetyl-gamma-glutamyl-phosphate reductase [Anaerovoracaceae bacterium]|nr:N-acetyl-gamma-glutamyl-phosphate reductase [Bacillota bacterium]MDY2671087.1 N-acetyl-gamma-glutamyl-phosphate reductase [Anaerovoracaceae bacterium]
MVKAGIIGATGYAGQTLVGILTNHPDAEVAFVSSNSYAGQKFSEIYPQYYEICDQTLLSTEEAKDAIGDVDVVFTALPNGLSFDIAKKAMAAGKKMVDFSADYRLDDVKVYEEWYKTEHQAKELLAQKVYGLPELWRDQIKGASLVANPGCYTTASIIAVSALVREEGLIDTNHIIIDAKSGITGSGRKKDISLLYSEAGESVKAYGIAHHRHTPEIEQEVSKAAGKDIMVQFTPHLMPMKHGIFATIYADLNKNVTTDDIYDVLENAYGDEKFVRIRKGMCESRFVVGSNYCDLSARVDERTHRVIISSCIDNMVKGAAGQAVQNMNIICGLDEAEGLSNLSIVAP